MNKEVDEIRNIDLQIMNLHNLQNTGIVNSVDVTIHELMTKKFKLKERMVLEKHNHTITKTQITRKNKIVIRWQTVCGNNRPRCSTYEGLIEKLYSYYYGESNITDFSFKNIFELALDEKTRTEHPKEKTIIDYRNSYKAFITEAMDKKDIRSIKPSELKQYIMDTVIRLNLTEKRLLKLKGILNLVYGYAISPEHKIMDISPVPTDNRVFKKQCRQINAKPEDKAFQPDEIDIIREYLWDRVHNQIYDVNGYAILFASWVGLREAEIPSLKWSDISGTTIHIHSQQNDEKRNGTKTYYYNPSTKNEKGISNGGRYFPMNKEILAILNELRDKQKSLGIETEWVFAKRDGSWITTAGYYEALYKVSKRLGLSLSNNHAFRIALNSYVFIPMGVPVTERARILGHSVDTNLRHYSFARTDDYLSELSDKWNDYIDNKECSGRGTLEYLKLLDFSTDKKSQKTLNFQALS